MDKIPITVVILTLNDEPHLPELLDSIQPYVEDIFIVDSRSRDRTVDIALERGIKIVQRAFTTPPDQYAWAFKNLPIKTEWLFSMDQDERFSPLLVKELRDLFDNGISPDVDGFTVKWRLWFMGRPLHAITDTFRLMRTKKCHVTEVSCNEHFVVPGKIVSLKGILEHKDVLNLHEWYEKQNLWTTLEAIGRIKDVSEDEKGKLFGTRLQRKMFFKRLFIHSIGGKFVMFLYYLFKYGAWKDGYAGWCWAKLRVWVHRVGDMKEKEFRRIGIPKILPTARHGDFDPRILASDLQRQLLPETCVWIPLFSRLVEEYRIGTSSLPLIALSKEARLPEAYGSGMLLRRGDDLLLITALHNVLLGVTTIQGEMRYVTDRYRITNIPSNSWNAYMDDGFRLNIERGDPYLDIAIANVSPNEEYVRWSLAIDSGVRSYPVRRFDFSDLFDCEDEEALHMGSYSMCGTVEPDEVNSGGVIEDLTTDMTTFTMAHNLKYERKDEYYIYFRLPCDFLKLNISLAGTSGTPIVSNDNKVVAVVCGGEDSPDQVRAIRIDAILGKHRSSSLKEIGLTKEAIDNAMSDFLSFVDAESRDFFWNEAQKGKLWCVRKSKCKKWLYKSLTQVMERIAHGK